MEWSRALFLFATSLANGYATVQHLRRNLEFSSNPELQLKGCIALRMFLQDLAIIEAAMSILEGIHEESAT